MKPNWKRFCWGLLLGALAVGRIMAEPLAEPKTVDLLKVKWVARGGAPDKTDTDFVQNDSGVAYTVKNLNGNAAETGPHLIVGLGGAKEWRGYQTLKMRMRLTSDTKAVLEGGKTLTFCFYDERTREELTQISLQQGVELHLPAGDWQDVSIDLRDLGRSRINAFDIWTRVQPYGITHEYKIEISKCELVGASEPVFDGDGMTAPLTAPPPPVAQQLSTPAGLGIQLGRGGEVGGLLLKGEQIGNPDQIGGVFVRDHASQEPPAFAGASVLQPSKGGLVQQGDLPKLNLRVENHYQVEGERVHVSMHVANLAKETRFLTLYFIVPLKVAPWKWWYDINNVRPVGRPASVDANGPFFETTTNLYPVAAMTTPEAGISLALPLDQPRNYRLGYNESAGLFYIAFDVALADIPSVSGGTFNEVTCDAYLYACDPKWGLRSALQNFYEAFPQWFVKHTKRDGGWETGGGLKGLTPEQIIASGCRFDWASRPNDHWTWNHEHGILNTIYVEPEYIQLSMTDLEPSDEAALDRLKKLADKDEGEWKKMEVLHYTKAYADEPYAIEHGLFEYHQMTAQAVLASGLVTADGRPRLDVGYRGGWVGENGLGMMVPCNIDPQIPNGRGQMAYTMLEGKAKRYFDLKKLTTDGWSLDSFICDNNYDYRKENFTYSSFPLTFERDHQQPAVPIRLTMAAWVKGLAERGLPSGKVIFGNVGGNLTFSVPYLDIYGTESDMVHDPAFQRSMAYRRSVTFLPYTPKPDLDVYFNMLYGIYPGRGLVQEQYDAMVPTLDLMTEAGWEPVTAATADVAKMRIERFGSGDHCYIACSNRDAQPIRTHVTLDAVLGTSFQKATMVFGPQKGRDFPINNGEFTVQLPPRQTAVYKVE